MPGCVGRTGMMVLILAVSGVASAPLFGQIPSLDQPPAVLVSQPPTPAERRQRESLYLYALGLLCEHEDRLLEALKAFEKSAELNPQAAPVFRALVPLYLALDKSTAALDATRKVLDLDPSDHGVWYLYGRQLKESGKAAEARAAFQRALALPSTKDHPDLVQQIYVDLALLHEAAEEFALAGAAFSRAAQILDHPDFFVERAPLTREMVAQRAAEVHERAGRMYLKAKQFDQALAAYQSAQKSDPGSAGRLNFHLAQIAQQQNRLAEAVQYLDAYLRLGPQGTEAYDLKIALLRTLRRDEEILPWLERAAKADPYNQGLKLVVAKEQGRTRPAEAEKLFLELATTNPTPELFAGLFGVYRDAGHSATALALLDKTLSEAKQRPPVPARPAQAKAMIAMLRQKGELAQDVLRAAGRPGAGALQPDTLMLLAALADHHRLMEEAERFYRKCLTNVPADNEPLVYGGLLRLLWKARKVDAVIQVCRDGLKQAKTTNHVLFHNDLAKALARQGKIDDALAEADRALALAKDTERLVLRGLRIRLLSLGERYDRAEAECLALLKEYSQPGQVLEIRYLLSSVYSAARNLAKAEEQLELVLKIDPHNATACNDLGYLWADQNKNLPQAEELIRKAIDLDRQQRRGLANPPSEPEPDNAAFVDSLGWVQFRRGQCDAALKELEHAAALPDGDDPTIWDHLGDVYYHLRRPAQARAAWDKARQLYEQENRHRRRADDRYREVVRKLQAVERETGSR